VGSDGDRAIGPQGLRSPRASSRAHITYEVLEGASHWIPDEAPERLGALFDRHFDAASTTGN